MKLFSWFIKKETNSAVNLVHGKESKSDCNSNNSMWPTAEVRNSTLVSQHQYLNSVKHDQDNKTSITLKHKGA